VTEYHSFVLRNSKKILFYFHWFGSIHRGSHGESHEHAPSYMSRYALLHGRMSSPLGRYALYYRLRYGFDVSSIFSHQFNPGRIIWKRHMYNISTKLQTRVEVLKDMLVYRVDKRQCILTNDEIESVIRLICTE